MRKQDLVIGDMDIAVIGMDGRFPMADGIKEYWENIREGRNCIWEGDAEKPNYVSAYGKIDHMYSYDYEFFHVSKNDANNMDPQYRIVMECVYRALEDAGYAGEGGDRSIGLFLGADENYYVWNNYYARKAKGKEFGRVPMFLQNTLSSNISYKLNLQGPSIVMRAACATSLVTVHYAIQSLLNYDCNMAVAGGVNIREDDNGYIIIDGVSSPTGKLCAYDEDGDGYVPGNGMGVVVLKRAEDAIEDKDRIYAIIKGSAVLNDGNRKAGYHASSVQGEAEAIRKAMTIAEVEPSDIQYIEGHGTATPLGDRVEIQAIAQAYSSWGEDYQCELGAVKANIGHLNVAAGVASLIKTILSLYHGEIAPAVHYKRPNPELLKTNGRIVVPETAHPWKKDVLRMAGISSFGFGGQDAHMILCEAPEREACMETRECYLIPYSAIDKASLERNQKSVREYLRKESYHPYELSYTMQTGKQHLSWRGYFLMNPSGEILKSKEAVSPAKEVKRLVYLLDEGEATWNQQVGEYVKKVWQDAELQEVTKEALDEVLRGCQEETYVVIGKEGCTWTPDQEENKVCHTILVTGSCKTERGCQKLLGELYLIGAPVAWEALYEEKPYKTSVPFYQFTQNEIKEIEELYVSGEEEKIESKENALNEGPAQDAKEASSDPSITESLLLMFQDALDIPELALDENIFEYDLDSLTSLMLNASIKEKYLVDIDISNFYELETIEAIAHFIEEKTQKETCVTNTIHKASRDKSLYDLSPGQRNMWFIYQYKQHDYSYISRYTLTVKGEQRLNLIEETFNRLVKRHPVLRTIYPVIDGVPYQMVTSPANLKPCGIYQIGEMGREEQEDFIYEHTLAEFNLEREIPMKYCIFHKDASESVIMIIFHHIAHDGWSMGIFMDEFYRIYENLLAGREPELPELPYDYVDYCQYLKEQEEKQDWKMDFWQNHFHGEVAELPFAVIEEGKREENGNLIRSLSKETVEKIHTLSNQLKITANEVYFAAYGILMSEVTGKNQFNAGTPVLSRSSKEFYDIIGYFSNTAVYHFQVDAQKDMREYLTGIHEEMGLVLGKYQISLEDLVRHLAYGKAQKDKLFNIIYSYQGQTRQNACLQGVKKIGESQFQVAQFNHKRKASTDFAMTFHVIDHGEGCDVGIGFQGIYFTKEQIGKLLDAYAGILEGMAEARTVADVLEERYEGMVSLSSTTQKEESGVTEKSKTTDIIYGIWKEILGEIPYEIDKPYFSLGGTSFTSFQALKSMNEAFGTEISITDFFRYSTIAELASLADGEEDREEETDEMNNMMF